MSVMDLPKLYLDCETDNQDGEGLNCFKNKVVTLQVMNEAGKVWIIKDPISLENMRNMLESSLIVGHNVKFDAIQLKHHYDIDLYYVYDTHIAEIVISGGLYAGKRGVTGLKDVVERRCGVAMSKAEQTGFQWGVPLTKEQEKYAADDLKYLPEIYRQQMEEIDHLELHEVINIEMGAIPAMVWLYLSGISFDPQRLADLRVQVAERKAHAQSILYRAFGSSKINFGSPIQIKKALENVGIYVEDASVDAIKGARVYYSKGAKAVGNKCKQTTLFGSEDELSPVEILDAITDYKEADKLLNTFIDRLPQFVNSVTGRVHANYFQLGAKSGRMSCSSPNLQQQPSKKLPEWRTIFTAPAGRRIVAADYSQAELRILTELSRDEHFVNAFQNGEDLHKLTASKIYHKPLDDVSKTERQICKSVNFGLSYGMAAGGLQRRLKTDSGIEITEDESKNIIKSFFQAYPGVANYLNNIAKHGLRDLQVRTKAGRLMLFESPVDEAEEGSIQRLSKNLPIQGLCSDFVKLALGNLWTRLHGRDVKLCAVIHDEIVLEVKEAEAEEVKQILEETMNEAIQKYITCIPAYAEGLVSDHWEH